jgi:hypothetical protein
MYVHYLFIGDLANFMFTPKYMLSSGKGYGKYGLALAASTMCALQGFWNFIVYARPRNYLTRKSLSRMASGVNTLFKSFARRMSNDAEKKKSGTTHAETNTPTHSEANTPASKPVMAIGPLFAAESEVVPFEAPDFEGADEHEIGATALQDPNPSVTESAKAISSLFEDPNPSVTETELVPLGILENGAADELAIGESADSQGQKDESNITSLVEAPTAVNEPEEHTSDSKVHSRFRSTLMDLRKRFIVTNSDEDQLAASGDGGGGLDPAIAARRHGDDADGTIDYLNDEEMFEMLLAG